MPRRHPEIERRIQTVTIGLTILAAGVLSACGGSTTAALPEQCTIPLDQFFDAAAESLSIPSLNNPLLATRGTPDIAYLTNSDRVIGFMFNGQPVAIPHKFLWHHEVVNMEIPGEAITVTYSPLTGSSAVYDRSATGLGPLEISRYVLHSGLVMTDEAGTLRPQMSPKASCGPNDGATLTQIPFDEMSFGSWRNLHLDTWIASSATSLERPWTRLGIASSVTLLLVLVGNP